MLVAVIMLVGDDQFQHGRVGMRMGRGGVGVDMFMSVVVSVMVVLVIVVMMIVLMSGGRRGDCDELHRALVEEP